MIQSQDELEQWYSKDDPWEYETSFDDVKRRDILLTEIPARTYQNVLDIGCGHGFITRSLPGESVCGIDVSERAIAHANKMAADTKRLSYRAADLFKLLTVFPRKRFDLIIITGVLYPQYIGSANTLIYHIIDQLLVPDGILVSVHISDWYDSHFPYLQLEKIVYDYRTFSHILEVYQK